MAFTVETNVGVVRVTSQSLARSQAAVAAFVAENKQAREWERALDLLVLPKERVRPRFRVVLLSNNTPRRAHRKVVVGRQQQQQHQRYKFSRDMFLDEKGQWAVPPGAWLDVEISTDNVVTLDTNERGCPVWSQGCSQHKCAQQQESSCMACQMVNSIRQHFHRWRRVQQNQ
jgi:hypothetical protein